ncbi:precorrin-6y C5,15-methyltransferase (decarboxylating) subunit CbiE [Carboxylicivirga sp. M1479]|uniref:precorrin-6y C5,15-methyltransferase (decarboxylating) subunit CbiE n=1 Tax=Carboxylicivirga sp. M1479 TaxID=2594476 RepID=UPI0011784853|nr:precorrin-6y C5,15-methyltransferase (decarboxylating) subunit CbiE [Carboxylicivirga sp. M1479]TRX70222.1 precorrin-6y C5,15-methyltransferase (decarboxylating) subunit CbiE [Carboxylicivirga sp. M1479]
MCSFHVIGISDESLPVFNKEVQELMASASYFSGGARHFELVQDLLPLDYQWIDVEVPLAKTFTHYEAIAEPIIVFASGDPLFFGLANTLKREFPSAAMNVYPSFNSLQMLAHACLLPYGHMSITTLTGRPWVNIDQELIKGKALIGVLTDKKKTPAAIAKRMLAAGINNYCAYLGERMGGERQRVQKLSIEQLSSVDAQMPNCLILEKTGDFKRSIGIPEEEMHHLAGRPKMMTKRSIRLMSLSILKLDAAKVMWDIGFCTGSVSIEAKQMAPHVDVYAIEKREESRDLMTKNQQKYRVPGINHSIGDFFEMDLSLWPEPDRVFIGGHGGRLELMLQKLDAVLQTDGIIVFNAVSSETEKIFREVTTRLGYGISDSMILQQDAHNPVNILQASKHKRNE